MAGQPIMRLFEQRVAQLGGEEVIMSRIAHGELMSDIADDYRINRHTLSLWLNNKKFPERRAAYKEARIEAAGALAEEGLSIVDQAPETRDGVGKAKAQAEYRQWLAGMWDRNSYAEKPPITANIELNIGELYIASLAEEIPRPALPPVKPEAITVEVEEIHEDGSESGTQSR